MNSGFVLCLTLSIGLLSSVNGQKYYCSQLPSAQNLMEDAYSDIPEVMEMEYDDDSQSDIRILVADCSLDGLPPNNSQSQPYLLPRISDEVGEGVEIWRHRFIGTVNHTATGRGPGNTSEHASYISVGWSTAMYVIRSNAKTKDFTRTYQTRFLYRNLVVYCNPNCILQRYHLHIPLQDITPPEFQQNEYNFHITADWDHNRPISQGQFVIVGDNAYEIQYNDSFLRYSASMENVLRVVPHRLWVQPNPRVFQYRLDLYLEESVVLTAGQHIQIFLSVKDDFSTGSTKINIYVGS